MKRMPWIAFAMAAAALASGGSPEEFTATAEMTTSQGTRSMPVAFVVSRPLTAAEARPLREVLERGGQLALKEAIRGADRGRERIGAFEYPIDLVIKEPVSDGFRYLLVTTRRLKYEEVRESRDSLDYPFAVAVFDMPEFGSGEGQLYTQASLAIDSEGGVRVSQYGSAPGRIKDIRRR
ncbi:MAG TPA: hypothetical protein VJ776_06820 [Thermoanaerobaculia bacterium]|nr:hypothetical protein [Thermoanaerobaculia bacterium]